MRRLILLLATLALLLTPVYAGAWSVTGPTKVADDTFDDADYSRGRRCFHAAGLHWVLYLDTYPWPAYYVYSEDGVSWSDPVMWASSAKSFGLRLGDDGYVHIAYVSGDNKLYYTRALPTQSGLVFDTAQRIVSSGTILATDIELDSNGYPWVIYTVGSGSSDCVNVTVSSTKNGTWTTAEGWPQQIHGYWPGHRVGILRLTAGKMLAFFYDPKFGLSDLFIRVWNGAAWEEIVTVTSFSSDFQTYDDITGASYGDRAFFMYYSGVFEGVGFAVYDYASHGIVLEEEVFEGDVAGLMLHELGECLYGFVHNSTGMYLMTYSFETETWGTPELLFEGYSPAYMYRITPPYETDQGVAGVLFMYAGDLYVFTFDPEIGGEEEEEQPPYSPPVQRPPGLVVTEEAELLIEDYSVTPMAEPVWRLGPGWMLLIIMILVVGAVVMLATGSVKHTIVVVIIVAILLSLLFPGMAYGRQEAATPLLVARSLGVVYVAGNPSGSVLTSPTVYLPDVDASMVLLQEGDAYRRIPFQKDYAGSLLIVTLPVTLPPGGSARILVVKPLKSYVGTFTTVLVPRLVSTSVTMVQGEARRLETYLVTNFYDRDFDTVLVLFNGTNVVRVETQAGLSLRLAYDDAANTTLATLPGLKRGEQVSLSVVRVEAPAENPFQRIVRILGYGLTVGQLLALALSIIVFAGVGVYVSERTDSIVTVILAMLAASVAAYWLVCLGVGVEPWMVVG